jgi:DNA-binding response OmpR family regulator
MRILIVEDEKEIRQFLEKSLRNECYIVDSAEDGEKGSFLARTNEYDLILLDNMMPGKTGLQVCEEIRKDGKVVPILVLSVKTESTTKADLLNAGADDYLTKPFSLDELLARIRALLRRPRAIENEVFQVEDLVLDSSKNTVIRAGKDVYLTRKEFALLKYLMKNAGTVLSRGMIVEHVWDMNADPFSNTIESHIVSWRKKVDVEGLKKLINTIPGRGYRIGD